MEETHAQAKPDFTRQPAVACIRMRRLVLLCAYLTALTGCRTPDYTKGQSNICQVHHGPMGKRTVPIAYGMIPMSRVEAEQGEWRRRMDHYPNPGDCLPATSINARGEKRAIVFVYSQCKAAFK